MERGTSRNRVRASSAGLKMRPGKNYASVHSRHAGKGQAVSDKAIQMVVKLLEGAIKPQ